MESRQRETWLDGLKGYGILLVILGHVLSGYLDAGTFSSAFVSFYRVRTWIYSFHMPLFFLISGFTFTLAYWQGGTLHKRRFLAQLLNLLWLYVVFALLQWVVKQLVPELVNESYDLEDLKGFLVVPLGNFWYIYVLAILYALSALFQVPRWHPMWGLLFGGVAIIALDSRMNQTALTQYRILYHLAFFSLGSILCRHQQILRNKNLIGVSVMFLATATFFYVCLYARNWYANWRFLIAVSTCIVNLWLFYHYPILSKPFGLFGKYSLELYLLHTFFTAGFRTLLPLMGVTLPWLSVGINFLLSTLGGMALAVFSRKGSWGNWIFRPASIITKLKA